MRVQEKVNNQIFGCEVHSQISENAYDEFLPQTIMRDNICTVSVAFTLSNWHKRDRNCKWKIYGRQHLFCVYMYSVHQLGCRGLLLLLLLRIGDQIWLFLYCCIAIENESLSLCKQRMPYECVHVSLYKC